MAVLALALVLAWAAPVAPSAALLRHICERGPGDSRHALAPLRRLRGGGNNVPVCAGMLQIWSSSCVRVAKRRRGLDVKV